MKLILAAILTSALYLGTVSVSFGQGLVVDGTFTGLSAPAGGELGYNETLTGWSSSGYNFVFGPGNAGDTSITSSYGAFSLTGPNNGVANGLITAPGGGNTLAADGAFTVGPISQVISGMTVGAVYAVSFEWAGAQQSGFTGAQTEAWSVALGGSGFTAGPGDTSGTLGSSQTTSVVNNSSTGFTGWMSQTFNFTATSSSETLYFLADGTPTGVPPFSLLADVSVVQASYVPETTGSASWMILFAMILVAGNYAWYRLQKRPLTVS